MNFRSIHECDLSCSEQEEGRRNATKPAYKDSVPPRRTEFPCISNSSTMTQRNEGSWEFTLDVSEDGSSVELAVAIGKHLDSTLVQVLLSSFGSIHKHATQTRNTAQCLQADVQPQWARLLIKGRLLQLRLPCEVHVERSYAQRSKATGALVLTMPRIDPTSKLDIICMRPKKSSKFFAAGISNCT